jgi:hypothetical protein
LTATDANGCSAVSQHLNISTYQVPSVSIVVQGDTLASFNAVSYLWFMDGYIIQGAVSSVYIAQQTGDYAVQITDSNGCRSLSNSVHIEVTGIEKMALPGDIVLHPNPASKELFITLKNGAQATEMQIVNMMGQVVKINELLSLNGTPNRIDISGLAAGAYECIFLNRETPTVRKRLFIK